MYKKKTSCDFINKHFQKETISGIMISFAPTEQSKMIDNSDQGRIFHHVIDYFGPSIAEHSNFNKNEKANRLFQRSCTISDEAYGIFTLERCWNTWMIEMVTKKKEPPRSSDYTKKNSNKICGGWTEEGLRRFTTIAKLVSESRESDNRKNSEEDYRQTQLQKFQDEAGYHYIEHRHIKENMGTATESFIPYNDFPEPNNDCETEEQSETYATELDDGKYIIIHTTHTLLLISFVLKHYFHFFIDIPKSPKCNEPINKKNEYKIQPNQNIQNCITNSNNENHHHLLHTTQKPTTHIFPFGKNTPQEDTEEDTEDDNENSEEQEYSQKRAIPEDSPNENFYNNSFNMQLNQEFLNISTKNPYYTAGV